MFKIFFWPIVIIILIFGFLYIQGRLDGITFPKLVHETSKIGCDEDCKRAVSEEVSKAVATISAKSKTQVVVRESARPQTSYISLGTSATTTSTGWTDASGIEVSFDIAQDFGASAKVSWEASLKVANGNGQVYARLFDVTHQVAVNGSEITTTGNSDYQRVNSGNLNLWAGRNVYRVQLKSLNSFEVGYTGGRIRVSY